VFGSPPGGDDSEHGGINRRTCHQGGHRRPCKCHKNSGSPSRADGSNVGQAACREGVKDFIASSINFHHRLYPEDETKP